LKLAIPSQIKHAHYVQGNNVYTPVIYILQYKDKTTRRKA